MTVRLHIDRLVLDRELDMTPRAFERALRDELSSLLAAKSGTDWTSRSTALVQSPGAVAGPRDSLAAQTARAIYEGLTS